ncbi:hypothetical protein OIU74_025686 [Salix koriyanagi]|uniref:Uncharacterized protein n=1 Tax=Salix koriyanagi TaxID=2511006 RepID=A0A9Q1A5I7_9ROSI|nr:hypothetical protein OIU74_025686 [Salix koriyanagi]
MRRSGGKGMVVKGADRREGGGRRGGILAGGIGKGGVAAASLGFLGLRFLVARFGVMGLEESPAVAILAEWERVMK